MSDELSIQNTKLSAMGKGREKEKSLIKGKQTRT